MKIAPCKDCDKRKIACHATCSDYQNWKIEHDKVQQILKENKKKDKEYDGYASQQIERRKRYERRMKS